MNEKDQVVAAQALRKMQEEIGGAAFAERRTMMAQLSYAKYRALIEAGFNEQQSLFLVAQSAF